MAVGSADVSKDGTLIADQLGPAEGAWAANAVVDLAAAR